MKYRVSFLRDSVLVLLVVEFAMSYTYCLILNIDFFRFAVYEAEIHGAAGGWLTTSIRRTKLRGLPGRRLFFPENNLRNL